MRRIQFGLWAASVSWICSAFIHASDPDINGFSGLWVPSVLVSVTVIALVIAIPAQLCGVAYAHRSWRGLLVSITMFALGMGCLLALLGSGGVTAKSWLASFGGASVLFWLVLFVAALPVVWVKRRERRTEVART